MSINEHELILTKMQLQQSIGEHFHLYLAYLKHWFRRSWTTNTFNLECRKLLTTEQLQLHFRFLRLLFDKIYNPPPLPDKQLTVSMSTDVTNEKLEYVTPTATPMPTMECDPSQNNTESTSVLVNPEKPSTSSAAAAAAALSSAVPIIQIHDENLNNQITNNNNNKEHKMKITCNKFKFTNVYNYLPKECKDIIIPPPSTTTSSSSSSSTTSSAAAAALTSIATQSAAAAALSSSASASASSSSSSSMLMSGSLLSGITLDHHQHHEQFPIQQRYAVNELFLPDTSLIMGRLLVSAWELQLQTVENKIADYMMIAVQILLKNILTEIVRNRKHSRTTANGKYFYDIGIQLKNPSLRNTIVRQKIDDENIDVTKGLQPIPATNKIKEKFLANCEQLESQNQSNPITLIDLYKTLQNKNIIPSEQVYSINMERIIQMLN